MLEIEDRDRKSLCLGLPVLEEASQAVYEAVAGGQPVLLVRQGQPAAVVLDLESWQEIEALVGE